MLWEGLILIDLLIESCTKMRGAFEVSLLTCAYLLKVCTIHYMYATVGLAHFVNTYKSCDILSLHVHSSIDMKNVHVVL